MDQSVGMKQSEKITYRHTDLDRLPVDEKCIFIQAGMVLNDLRFFDLLLHRHIKALSTGAVRYDAERGIVLSQITLLIAHLAGTLNEAHQVITRSYYLPTVSKKYSPLLSAGAADALSHIKVFFSKKDNLVSTIRNNFGYHYDREKIKDILNHLPPSWEHNVYLPCSLNNAFMEFGQVCSMNALFKSTGARNPVEGLFRVYEVLGVHLMRDFVAFFHGVLQAMTKTIPAKAVPHTMRISDSSPALFNTEFESFISDGAKSS